MPNTVRIDNPEADLPFEKIGLVRLNMVSKRLVAESSRLG